MYLKIIKTRWAVAEDGVSKAEVEIRVSGPATLSLRP